MPCLRLTRWYGSSFVHLTWVWEIEWINGVSGIFVNITRWGIHHHLCCNWDGQREQRNERHRKMMKRWRRWLQDFRAVSFLWRWQSVFCVCRSWRIRSRTLMWGPASLCRWQTNPEHRWRAAKVKRRLCRHQGNKLLKWKLVKVKSEFIYSRFCA